jgi:hypothetical protein
MKKALGGLLLLSSSLVGCGVPQAEVDRQKAEAFDRGYSRGVLAEQKRCEAKIESIEAKHQATVDQLESEKTGLYWAGVGSGVFGASIAIGVGLFVLGAGGAVVYRLSHKRRGAASDNYEPTFRRPPPSVTDAT